MLAGGRAITRTGVERKPNGAAGKAGPNELAGVRPTAAQVRYLRRGLDQPGGKLPLFDDSGAAISPRTIRSCVKQGWAAPWISNPVKPDWFVCKLTDRGRSAVVDEPSVT